MRAKKRGSACCDSRHISPRLAPRKDSQTNSTATRTVAICWPMLNLAFAGGAVSGSFSGEIEGFICLLPHCQVEESSLDSTGSVRPCVALNASGKIDSNRGAQCKDTFH